jgi:hypothetical protein
MLSDKAVEAIQDGVKTGIIQVNGVDYTTRPVFDPRVKEPEAETLTVNTLTGLVHYIESNVDSLDLTALVIHIEGHDAVSLLGPLRGRFKQREEYLTAHSEPVLCRTFNFATYYDNESFIIALQSLFVMTDELESILRIVGNIKEEAVKTHVDDGISQSVTARAGIARVEEVQVPNPVTLQPFRTFRELDQPPSVFILRMRQNSGQKPTCALFEADGGKWKLDAIQRIKDYLSEHIEGVSIIA